MTYPPAQPPAPSAPAFPTAPAPAPKRGLPWWGWLLVALSAVGVVSTGVFTAQAVSALVGLPGVSQGAGPAVPEPGAEEPAASGVVYESDDFPFEVTFPGETTRQVLGQEVVGFDVELILVTWSSGRSNVFVGSTGLPAELLPGGGSDDQLTGSIEGAATSVGGVLEDVEFIEISGERAVTGTITASGSTLYAAVFFHDSVQYQLFSENRTLAEHEAFVDSFRFTD